MEKVIIGENLKKTFTTGEVSQEVLKGVTVSIEVGEFVAVMGKSGAGKSTLLYQLSALDRPTAGEVIIAGKNVSDMNEDELARFRLYTLGYVFQDYALIPDLSAIENVQVTLLMRGIDWDEAYVRASSSLEEVGLYGKQKNLPSQLSGGEQQRISIARAIVGDPKILFADEPTANLDSASSQTVIDLLTKLNKNGQTIAMVTHEREYTENCNRVIYLEDGMIRDQNFAM